MEQTQDKAIGLLGLARKAGKLQTGEESVGSLLLQKARAADRSGQRRRRGSQPEDARAG